ncbi:MAG: PQQ-binding-like beta-propeller repeat protein, partial [Planctomycetota bacterium]
MLRANCTLLAALILFSPSHADNWPRWRGPTGNGLAADGVYPSKFSSTESVAWKVELPGRGSSTPVVWGDKIFVTCPIDGKDGVVCYSFDGQELWRQSFGEARQGKHRNGSSSNPSPVTDGKSVVVYYKSGTVACVDFAGNIKWETNLQDAYGEDTLWWDLGTSPVIAADNAVIAVMQDGVKKDSDSFLVALKLDSGEVAWKQPRSFECAEESDQSYTTPSVLQRDDREVIVTFGADHLTGHDAATGKPLWQCGGFNPDDEGWWRVIASAAVDDELAIVPYGRGEYLAAIDVSDPTGDITA